VIAVDELTGAWAHQLLVDTAAAGQPARCAIGCGATVVDLAGGKPAIGHRQYPAVAGGLVGQQWPDRTHRSVADRAPVGAPPHTAFHRGHVEVFDHDVAVYARQLGGELVGGFAP
jgi:hypothetical protein